MEMEPQTEVECSYHHDESGLLYERGVTAMRAQHYPEAVACFEQSIRLRPHFKSLELLGECLMRLERHQEAIVPLAAATALNQQSRAPMLLAQVFLTLGTLDRAAEMAELALRRAPDNRRAREVLEQVNSRGAGRSSPEE